MSVDITHWVKVVIFRIGEPGPYQSLLHDPYTARVLMTSLVTASETFKFVSGEKLPPLYQLTKPWFVRTMAACLPYYVASEIQRLIPLERLHQHHGISRSTYGPRSDRRVS